MVFLMFFLSSSFFRLSGVEIVFFDENFNKINLNSNIILNNNESVAKMSLVARRDFGTSMFLLNKDKYSSIFESQNPYAKLLAVESKFPNKLVFSVTERKPVFCLSSGEGITFLLDGEFKILKITKDQAPLNLIPILIQTNSSNFVSFFEFFDVAEVAFSEGQFLTENNLVIKAMVRLYDLLGNSHFSSKKDNLFTGLVLSEGEERMNLVLTTGRDYGVKLKVEGVLDNFNKKFEKLLSALSTLEVKEKIKTTYGTLIINSAYNCFWNKL